MAGSFLEEPPVSPQVQALFDDDLRDDGYVGNVTRLWAHQFAWSGKLDKASGTPLAAGVLTGDDGG